MKKKCGLFRARIMILLAAMISVALLCASCGRPDSGAESETAAGNIYEIYTVDLGGGPGDPYEFPCDETDPQALAETLVAQMAAEPEVTGSGPAIPAGVTAPEVAVSGSVATLAYGADYTELSAVSEVLSRAAVVKTLGQIPEVNYVLFTVDGEPLTDAAGDPVGYMQPSDFISSISTMDEAGTAELLLWFLNAETGELEPVRQEVTFASHTTRETAAVRALIEGPADEAYLPTLPPSTRLINVQVRDRVCYVNLGSEFLDEALDLEVQVPVDSLVLTLLEMDEVDMVQILIEGSSAVGFRDLIPFDAPFTTTAEGMGYLPLTDAPGREE